MKTLQTIQKLSRLGRILSKIVFVFSIVGLLFCVAGIVCLALLPESVEIDGLSIHSLIEKEADISVGTCYAGLAMGIVFCLGEAVLAKMGARYFTNELAAGTPFTFPGAKELQRLGICAVAVPVASHLAARIVFEILQHVLQDVEDISAGGEFSLGLGLMLIVTGLLCRYGAEVAEKARS